MVLVGLKVVVRLGGHVRDVGGERTKRRRGTESRGAWLLRRMCRRGRGQGLARASDLRRHTAEIPALRSTTFLTLLSHLPLQGLDIKWCNKQRKADARYGKRVRTEMRKGRGFRSGWVAVCFRLCKRAGFRYWRSGIVPRHNPSLTSNSMHASRRSTCIVASRLVLWSQRLET